MIYAFLLFLAMAVAFVVRIERLQRQVTDIDTELDEMDEDITSTFGAVGGHIGALTVRADRFEAQLGGAANSKAQGADVFAILNEAQAWAAANEARVVPGPVVPVPVVQGFVGFPQDYDPTYHFGGQQMFVPEGELKPSLVWGNAQTAPTLNNTGAAPVDYSRDR